MRNLVVCCDGTWNTAAQTSSGLPDPTNVVRIYNAVADRNSDGDEQLKYYHPGVGTDGGLLERLKGGALGDGLDYNIQSAYQWLACQYQDGDRIFVFGFSRGAYTARSLVGMIYRCGLLDLGGEPNQVAWDRVKAAFDRGYRLTDKSGTWPDPAWPMHGGALIHFLGVWETVGALGIPQELAILNLLDNPDRYRFHDTALSPIVVHARHAVAIDECRADYCPALWTTVPDGCDVVQLWFPGCHSDVGGGYLERGLGDSTLKWMMVEAGDCKLGLVQGMVDQVRPNAQDVLHDSTAGVMKIARTEPRCIPAIDPNDPQISPTAISRQANPPIAQCPYRPTRRLAVGESVTVTVYAAEHWNDPGLFLDNGAYEFTAEGTWLDKDSRFDAGGDWKHSFNIGDVVRGFGSLLGNLEPAFQAVTHDDHVDLLGTKREEKYPWFMLIGVVANGRQQAPNLPPNDHQVIPIGNRKTDTVQSRGYLYCYANDAWALYGNNRGSVQLTVTRTA